MRGHPAYTNIVAAVGRTNPFEPYVPFNSNEPFNWTQHLLTTMPANLNVEELTDKGWGNNGVVSLIETEADVKAFAGYVAQLIEAGESAGFEVGISSFPDPEVGDQALYVWTRDLHKEEGDSCAST